ncbi:urea transporter [Paraburkholderia phosphatilytica]|uniref:urea transporter n=1 Tax=Paraburkholderia phosphatilytica TaxID=2282883 RepID=UPI000E4E942D|nr:urea transporter [Paraburkholderia phosphatilytica]
MSATSDPTPIALRTLLRSVGQIVLQPNAWTGLCVLAALAIGAPRLACAAVTGAIAANIGALLAGCDEHEQHDGLYGFNGALAAIAANVFVDDAATAMAVALLASTATGWCQPALARRLRMFGVACYSSPCLVVSWCWLALMQPVHVVTASAPLTPQVWTAATLANGVLAGIAQTTFASGAWAGALVLAGIALSSRRHAGWALAGAALAGAIQLALSDTGATSFTQGLAGFNGALTALALADCGALATLAGVLLAVALQQWTGYYHWPAMTAPFVLATWVAQRVTAWATRKRHGTHRSTSARIVRAARQALVRRIIESRSRRCRSLTTPRDASPPAAPSARRNS